jgi:hypothetical protein
MFPRVFQKRPVGEGEINGGILVRQDGNPESPPPVGNRREG